MEAGGDVGRRDAGVMLLQERGEHRGWLDDPCAVGGREGDGVAAAVGVAGDAFELDGSLGFVIDRMAVEDDGGHGIKEAAQAGGERARAAAGDELEQEGSFCCREAEAVSG
jgi:hypothetical protein